MNRFTLLCVAAGMALPSLALAQETAPEKPPAVLKPSVIAVPP